MEKRILVAAVMLLVAAGMAQAQEAELHGWVDLTFSSKYVWRGFDIFDDKSAIHPGVDLNMGGFGINVTGHRANSGEFENGERWDYNLYYAGGLNMDQSYALQYRLGWVYYNFPDNSSGLADLQEAHAILSLPKITQVGVVPSYVLVKLWPSESGSMVASKADLSTGLPSTGTASGWAHIFMLDYALTTEGLQPEAPEQVWNFHAEAVASGRADRMSTTTGRTSSSASRQTLIWPRMSFSLLGCIIRSPWTIRSIPIRTRHGSAWV